MRVFIDTDVLVDVALDRRPHAVAAGMLLDRLERNEAAGFMAWQARNLTVYGKPARVS